MIISDALAYGKIDQVDREILLAAALECDRTWLFAHNDDWLNSNAHGRYLVMVDRRERGEPIAYILGKKEFYNRIFDINESTLIPRPATELLTEQVLRVLRGETVEGVLPIDNEIVAWTELKGDTQDVRLVADIGTGSGCIGITLACELPTIRVIATDISEHTLYTAAQNARTHGVEDRMSFVLGINTEPLENIREPFVLVSNPPYIPQNAVLPRDVLDYEPHWALWAGADGTEMLQVLSAAARTHPFCRGFIMECRAEQVVH